MKIPFFNLFLSLFDEENCENCGYGKRRATAHMICTCTSSKNFRKFMLVDRYCDEWKER